jgi:hypothetical protein
MKKNVYDTNKELEIYIRYEYVQPRHTILPMMNLLAPNLKQIGRTMAVEIHSRIKQR